MSVGWERASSLESRASSPITITNYDYDDDYEHEIRYPKSDVRFTTKARRTRRIPFVIDHLAIFIGRFGLLVIGDCLIVIGYLESSRMVQDKEER